MHTDDMDANKMAAVEQTASTWDDLQQILSRYDDTDGCEDGREPTLFRGHQNAKWTLQTTLERSVKPEIAIGHYIHEAQSIYAQLQSFATGVIDAAILPNLSERSYINDRDGLGLFFQGLPNPTVEVFLRQFGFPSPLLDWTHSPFVAAFFAMAGNHFDDDGEAAIYVLIDNRSKPSGQSMPDPSGTCLSRINRAGYTHRRHYLQQAEYTYCYKTEPGDEPRQYFSCHDDYFSENKYPRIEKVRFS